MILESNRSDKNGTFEKTIFISNLKQICGFRPNVNLLIQKNNFIIKTAQTDAEVNETLRLRYDVFRKEIVGKKRLFELDMDRYDMMSDHLILIDKTTDSVVGTYRLNCTAYSHIFYSEEEFNISGLMRQDGVKLELGRAYIDKDYRNINMIGLLWMGLIEYMKLTGTKYLFGSSSIKTSDFLQIAIVYRYLRDFHYSSRELRVHPLMKYRIKNMESYISEIENSDVMSDYGIAKKQMPSLLNAYLMAGARICGEPAYNRTFNCADFFTLLDVGGLNRVIVAGSSINIQ